MVYSAVRVLKDVYCDSVVLMGTAARIKGGDGVLEAAFFMGTDANKKLLAAVGLDLPEAAGAENGDIMLGIRADNKSAGQKALEEAVAALLGKKKAGDDQASGPTRPRSLRSAIREFSANLAFISLPGEYVEPEAMLALKNNLNLFIFSDNVPLAAEVRIKREAASRGLLCMGPDCGTAWINGKGLGFCNAVPRGRVGIISASGTGLQSVACLLAAQGEGISHGIGVGGRDLSREVGGLMTMQAFAMLDKDPGTEVILIISKPPAEETMAGLSALLAKRTKPVILACLGMSAREDGGLLRVSTFGGAAEAVLALLQNRAPRWRSFADEATVRAAIATHAPVAGAVLGLYTGGTLAHEAELILEPLLGAVTFGDEAAAREGKHCILDLGDDQYTQGRPHPMIDPRPRTELLETLASGWDGNLPGVILFDVVLGSCSHPDPAGHIASAVRAVQKRCGETAPVFVASVVGTANDTQNMERQCAVLREAGVILMPDNAQAARLAGLLAHPEKTPALCREGAGGAV